MANRKQVSSMHVPIWLPGSRVINTDKNGQSDSGPFLASKKLWSWECLYKLFHR